MKIVWNNKEIIYQLYFIKDMLDRFNRKRESRIIYDIIKKLGG